MTHTDIKTKFMIEYDKANVTSSYPSLTEYEVATLLDKAYLALIAQKVTGNNARRTPFESDTKSVADLQRLVTHVDVRTFNNGHEPAINVTLFELPDDYLYNVQVLLNYNTNTSRHIKQDNSNGKPYDTIENRQLPCRLVSHDMAEKFFATPYNMPWVKIPVCFIEGNIMYIVYDPVDIPSPIHNVGVHYVYIRKPNSFVANLGDNAEFELSDSMAEELINLAIVFALENVESTRLNTKLNTRGLEA